VSVVPFVRRLCAVAAASLMAASLSAHGQTSVEVERTGGPYVPTPQVIVDRMLEVGKIGPKDFVIDLGSGDGRIVITAAKRHGASGFGIEIDPELIERSNAMARKEGVEARVSFRQFDMFTADIGKATVLTLYVLPGMMDRLRPKVLRELQPGTRIVSHDYHFGDWAPDNRISFESAEKQASVGFSTVNLYLWVVPAHAAGEWKIESGDPALKGITLQLSQVFQRLSGQAVTPHGTFDLADASLRGREVRFSFPATAKRDGPRHVFRGRVDGASMQGDLEGPAGKSRNIDWKASRSAAPAEALAK
jgi:hypothetical protein